ncbi:ThiF family adenylyltransferase [Bacillus sp. SL00103]
MRKNARSCWRWICHHFGSRLAEWSNLQRQQILHRARCAGAGHKGRCMENRLKQINSDVKVKGIVVDVTAEQIDEPVSGASMIVDAMG